MIYLEKPVKHLYKGSDGNLESLILKLFEVSEKEVLDGNILELVVQKVYQEKVE